MRMLIANPAVRAEAAERKLMILLKFLRDELWTSLPLAAKLMGLTDPRAIRRSLGHIARSGLIVRDRLPGGLYVIGITMQGQAWVSARLGQQMMERCYERRRVGLATAAHRLDVQSLRLSFEAKGWSGWRYPDRVAPHEARRRLHRPDALAINPHGEERVAIECERTLKIRRRYRSILGSHLDALNRGEYAKVIYATPTEQHAEALKRIFSGLGYVLAGGRQTPAAEVLRATIIVTYDNIKELL